MKENPTTLFPFTFDITDVPERAKTLTLIMQRRTDEKAIKIKEKNTKILLHYLDWLEKAKWYLAYKAYKADRVEDKHLEIYGELSRGYEKGVALQAAFNEIKDYYKNHKR